MRVQQLLAKRTADAPKDAVMASHRYLVRGGYIRQVGQGLYTLLPLAQRIRHKVERIIREEMERVEGQEISMPVVAPAELWKASGRYDQIGGELVRFDDRTGHPHVLNMTHEEAVVDAVSFGIESYRQLPLMVFQIQTKFRDEPRSRGGLVRVREFTMKDAYSFHRTADDLGNYYQRMHEAYVRIFARLGLTQVVDIESDVGMMGGDRAHEFMALSPHGEDTLLLCDSCGYRANREVATTFRAPRPTVELQALAEVSTPGTKTIEEVSSFLGVSPAQTAKAVLFMARLAATPEDKSAASEERLSGELPVIAFVRGDLEVNQAKLRNVGKFLQLRPMTVEEAQSLGVVVGYVGPEGLPSKISIFFDTSLIHASNLVVGANKVDRHMTGFNLSRDQANPVVHDLAEVKEGDPCPNCKEDLRVARGIEVGNIFQLGLKYTSSMGFEYLEENGKTQHPTMGCYGIGVGRTLACIVEEHHDDNGPIWPMPVAPFAVQVCCLQVKKPGVLDAGRSIYEALSSAGLTVLLDDRKVGTGFMFSDADLIAAPVRVIVSPRNLVGQEVELRLRLPEGFGEDTVLKQLIPASQLVPMASVNSVVQAVVERLHNMYPAN